MKIKDIKINRIYRFKSGIFKDNPCKVTDITRDEADSHHDVNYKITAGPKTGTTVIEPISTFARSVKEA